MPVAATRLCPGGCGALVTRGRCQACTRRVLPGSTTERGYDGMWRRFRKRYVSLLVQQGIVPCCGATLPNGPQCGPTECQQQRLITVSNLHLDHEPPLRDAERRDPRKVCDPLRVRLLCQREHGMKSRREQGRGGW